MQTQNNQSAISLVRQIKRNTRRVFTAEEKIANLIEVNVMNRKKFRNY